MNVARGLFRLWSVLSILWVAFIGVIERPDRAAREYWTRLTADSPASENVPGITKVLRPGPDQEFYEVHFENGGVYEVEIVQSEKKLRATAKGGPAYVKSGRTLSKVEEQKMLDALKRDILAEARRKARRRALEHSTSELRRFAIVGLLPPTLMFLIGAAFLWAFRGFRAS